MEAAIILILSVGVFVLIIVWAVRYTKKVNRRKEQYFVDFANKHDLGHNQTKYLLTMLNTVQGTWDGMPFLLYEKMEGSGKNKSVVTRAIIENVPFDYDFKIGREHIFSKAGKMLGLKDIEFGDEEFDKKFLIKAKQEPEFRAFFNYKLQDQLKQIKGDLGATIRVQNGTMTYLNYGPLANEKSFQSFEKVVDFMFSLIKEAQNSRGHSSQVKPKRPPIQ